TFVFLAICCAAAIAAALVGISDNLPGILLALGAAIALVLAAVHPWRSAKRFGLLLCVAVLGFVLFGVLHNVFEGVADRVEGVAALRILLQGLGVVAFLLAILICPPAILVGAVGAIVMYIRNRHRPPQARPERGG
ncbi:hypothetical protein ACFL6M_00525, partial [Candidatus Eisenbacteria bacterium]